LRSSTVGYDSRESPAAHVSIAGLTLERKPSKRQGLNRIEVPASTGHWQKVPALYRGRWSPGYHPPSIVQLPIACDPDGAILSGDGEHQDVRRCDLSQTLAALLGVVFGEAERATYLTGILPAMSFAFLISFAGAT